LGAFEMRGNLLWQSGGMYVWKVTTPPSKNSRAKMQIGAVSYKLDGADKLHQSFSFSLGDNDSFFEDALATYNSLGPTTERMLEIVEILPAKEIEQKHENESFCDSLRHMFAEKSEATIMSYFRDRNTTDEDKNLAPSLKAVQGLIKISTAERICGFSAIPCRCIVRRRKGLRTYFFLQYVSVARVVLVAHAVPCEIH
jgi:hypothetical protein